MAHPVGSSQLQSNAPTPARESLERALADNEARFRALFALSGAGVAITRGDASITYVNDAFAGMLGYAPDELIGRSLISLGPPGQGNPLAAGVRALRAGESNAVTMERTYLRRDGELVFAALSVHMLPLPAEVAAAAASDKTLARFVGITQDITDRKRVEAQLRDNQHLLQEAQRIGKIGHWVWKPQTGDVTWSDELCSILGLAPGTSPRDAGPFDTFVFPDDLPAFRGALHALMSGETGTSLEYRLRQRNGDVRDVVGRSQAERGPDGTVVRCVGTVQDITDRKRDEAILREAMAHAEAANRAKTKFLAAMSHELRTPLNAILGFAQLLSLKTHGPLLPVQAAYVSNIIQGGEHLLRLINDVLDLARIDTGKLILNLRPVALDELVESMARDFQTMAAARAVTTTVVPSPDGRNVVKADHMRLTQVVVNLLSNAIKYNRRGGRVTLSVGMIRPGVIRLSIQDTGRGIPVDRHHEVFESFNRLGAEITGEEGTGIGLSLSKRLVEEMGGTIGFASVVNEGTTFWVDLPSADEPADTIAPSLVATRAG